MTQYKKSKYRCLLIIVGCLILALLCSSCILPTDSIVDSNSTDVGLKVRCMTYNIWVGGTPRTVSGRPVPWGNGYQTAMGDRLPLIIEVIKDIKPDIVLLQECTGWGDEDNKILDYVAEKLNMYGAIAPNHTENKVAILSRFPIENCWWLADDNPFGHNMIFAKLQLPNQSHLVVSSCHYGWWETAGWTWKDEKKMRELYRLQNDILLQEMAKYRDAHFILGGDLNHNPKRSLYGEPPLYAQLMDAQYVDTYYRLHGTYQGKRTYGQGVIDYIFVSPYLAEHCITAEIVDNPATYLASDHLPVWTDFWVPSLKECTFQK